MAFTVGNYMVEIDFINTQDERLGHIQEHIIITKRTKKTMTFIASVGMNGHNEKKCKIYEEEGREYIKFFTNNICFGEWQICKTYADGLKLIVNKTV